VAGPQIASGPMTATGAAGNDNVLLISNDAGNDPHNPALGRILSEQDIKVVRMIDSRIAEAFDRLDISTAHDRCRTTKSSAQNTWSPWVCPSRPHPVSRTDPRIDVDVCLCGHVESHPLSAV
jgi:hypothetical protein